MPQVKRRHRTGGQVALRGVAASRTVAQRRADIEAQIREQIEAAMALTQSDLENVGKRLKALRAELARKRGVREVSQQEVSTTVGKAIRTFQSHENGEVEPRDDAYGKYAAYYSAEIGREVTRNWIVWGADEPPVEERGPTPEPFGNSSEPTWAADIKNDLKELQQDVADLGERIGELALAEPPPAGDPEQHEDHTEDEEDTGST